ncbi:synaptic vesicle glycoprotein 2A-like [Aricia agestis]|uniref:synaptic vesicle glycoprotein 2A-like n=1 Tax=Aricia agestis TaxID=91739 RepID=UPI001C203EFF|nr:synaptic vesicle glycoprotein 2A-like [Aricia agestis]XP_041987523.1 synaptic vesicle glycoprotein 2A-like [Aricia agestis]XP_041987532.1 synaptic vesicle glycoprotein 2A-like [Aricia agestis]
MEEQACLVHTDSENSSKLGSFGSLSHTMTYTEDRLTGAEGAGEPGHAVTMATAPPDPADGNESGELLDYNDSSVLEQFHEDALRQAGCGVSQARVLLAVGLALAGSSLELSAIPFVLPSAEIELCVLPHQKNWLVLISVVGCGLGGVGWGALGERVGRRRALLSALAVNAVFATIAAFMPTYGTFMMARFCSALGSGGIAPTGFTYAGECLSRGRRVLLAVLPGAAALGALTAAGLASAILPPTGADTLIENKEHFSAWHRYLLLCTLPILASLISLIWTQESPRYLLDVGREVDAMMVYQSIHSSNQVRICGKASADDYRLGELTLPPKRRPPALHHVRHSVKMFWQTFFQLFATAYRNTTLSLGGTLLFFMAIQFYLSSFVPATIASAEEVQFASATRTVSSSELQSELYTGTLENVRYDNVTFRACTFRDMLLSHVAFTNCSFYNVAFSNIKSSYTSFENSLFVNSTIIDTDMEVGSELSDCVLVSTIVRGIRGACARHADLRSALRGALAERVYAASAALLAAPLAPPAARLLVLPCALGVLLAPALLVHGETALYAVEAAYALLATLVFYAVAVKIIDHYPANLRCTAHGLMLSVTFMGGAVVKGAGEGGPVVSGLLCAALAAAAAALAARLR